MQTASTYIPMDRRQALARGETLPDHTYGTALFSDISGFTPLTEGLVRALGPQRGTEELTRRLNDVYDSLIAEVHRYGGSVIGFAGDAITCWFDADSGLRATAAGLAMQAAMQRFASVPILPGQTVALTAKVAVATGPARRFVVGNPDIQYLDALAGTTLVRMAAAEHLAARGEVVLDEMPAVQVRNALEVAEWRVDPESGRRCAVVRALARPIADAPWSPLPSDALDEAQVGSWLLPPVYERLRRGQGAFLAELRPTVALFLAFTGIDYDGDEGAGEKLDAYTRWVQEILLRWGGSLIQITIGDKGSNIYSTFGAPLTHGDEGARAVAAALELQFPPPSLDYIRAPRIGIATGRTFCGPTGGAMHYQYAVMGDSVNLAARLMQAAPAEGILVSDRVQAAAARGFTWEQLPPFSVKGKAEPVTVFRPITAAARRVPHLQEPQYTLPLVGRDEELALIDRATQQALSAQGQIVAISAEAGMGKSRLVAETVRRSGKREFDIYIGECQSYGTNMGYLVWQSVWRSFFRLDENETLEDQVQSLEQQLAAIDPTLVPRLPLLGVVLNLPLPENDLTHSLDAKLRKASLEALLIDCLRARARTMPLLIVLEDCHWLDPLSHDLLEAIGRVLADLRVLLVVAYRPPEVERLQAPRITGLPWCTQVELASLTVGESEQLIGLKLAQFAGERASPSTELLARIAERAQGNPFFIEELLNYLHDCGLDPGDARALQRLDLPSSLHSLILTRIDQLAESQKITIKVASIIGRQFRMAWLWGVHAEIGTPETVRNDLDALSRLDLTPLDQPEPERIYLFKHIVTREVAYESLPYATRASLHGELGQFIERCYADSLSQYVDLLAYHYDLSGIESKKREYLRKAGEAAQAAYANEAAIDYYRRLLPLLSDEEEVMVLLQLGHVLELVGEFAEAGELYRRALHLAEEADDVLRQATARQSLGWLLRKQGEYYEAAHWLTQAQAGFDALGDRAAVSRVMADIGEVTRQVGAYAEAKKWYEDALNLAASLEQRDARLVAEAQALKGAGTLANQQGDHAAARERYEASLAIRRELDDRPGVAVLLANLGIVAYCLGDYATAESLDHESLAIFREIGDRWSTGTLLNNLGDIARDQAHYAPARQLLTESLEIRRELGDMGGIAFSLNSLGDVLLDQGDCAAARPVLVESLSINRDLGDRVAMAYLLDDFAALTAAENRPEHALLLAGAALAAHGAIGSQLSAIERARFERLQAPAWKALDEPTAATAYTAGQAMTLEQGVEYALSNEPAAAAVA